MVEEKTIGEQSPKTNNSKGSKTAVTIIIIVVVVLAILSVGGYLISRFVIKKVAEKTTESIIEGATGGDVDINSDSGDFSVQSGDDSFSISSENSWPDDMPSSVPEFTYGTIGVSSTSSSGDGSGWSLTFADVESNAYDKYASDLESAGWNETGTITSGDDKILNMESDSYYLIFTYNSSDSTGSLVVTSK